MARKPKVKVYQRYGPNSVLIGPANTWAVGDEVSIPAREKGTMDNADPGPPAFDGVVNQIAQDGLARVGERREDDPDVA